MRSTCLPSRLCQRSTCRPTLMARLGRFARVALDLDVLRAATAELRHLISGLDTHEMIGIGTEGLVNAIGHLGRQGGFAVDEIGESRAAHAKYFRRLRNRQIKRLQNAPVDHVARMRRVLHLHGSFLSNSPQYRVPTRPCPGRRRSTACSW